MGQCSDLRDRIFSLLSMASGGPPGNECGLCSFVADYQMSYDEVVVRTVAHCGFEEGEQFFAILGRGRSLSSAFQHSVEILKACSRLLIESNCEQTSSAK